MLDSREVRDGIHASSVGAFREYLDILGVRTTPRATSAIDPGYDPATVEAHLQQSGHVLGTLKLSMSCWLVADRDATVRKVKAAKEAGVATVTGGGPFEIAVTQGALGRYLDLCAALGCDRVECGEGFTSLQVAPTAVVSGAHDRGLGVEFELGLKHGGKFTDDVLDGLLAQGSAWLEAGAERLIVEARESADDVGLFSEPGVFDAVQANRLVEAFGLERLLFEAPDKRSQFALIDHFGAEVRLGNVRLEEVLRVEIYRLGLHADAFAKPQLRPEPRRHPVRQG